MQLRLSREPVQKPADTSVSIGEEMWVLEVEFPSGWRSGIPPIPPPRSAPLEKVEFPEAPPLDHSSSEKSSISSASVRARLLWKRLVRDTLRVGRS